MSRSIYKKKCPGEFKQYKTASKCRNKTKIPQYKKKNPHKKPTLVNTKYSIDFRLPFYLYAFYILIKSEPKREGIKKNRMPLILYSFVKGNDMLHRLTSLKPQ